MDGDRGYRKRRGRKRSLLGISQIKKKRIHESVDSIIPSKGKSEEDIDNILEYIQKTGIGFTRKKIQKCYKKELTFRKKVNKKRIFQ